MSKFGDVTASARLCNVAESSLLQANRDPERALARFQTIVFGSAALKRSIALEYLQQAAAKLGQPAQPEQPRPTQSAQPERPTQSAQPERPTQSAYKAEKVMPLPPSLPPPPLVRREQRPRTAAEIAAARFVRLDTAVAILNSHRFGISRPFGSLSWDTLRSCIPETTQHGTAILLKMTHRFEDVVLGKKLLAYYQVSDGSAKIGDVVKPSVLKRFEREAREETPVLLAEAMKRVGMIMGGEQAALR